MWSRTLLVMQGNWAHVSDGSRDGVMNRTALTNLSDLHVHLHASATFLDMGKEGLKLWQKLEGDGKA